MKKNINKFWFTLIELLVVVTIIGILLTGATTIYISQYEKPLENFIKEIWTKIKDHNSTSTWSKIVTKEDFVNFANQSSLVDILKNYNNKYDKLWYWIYFNWIENGSFCVWFYKDKSWRIRSNTRIWDKTNLLKRLDKYYYEYCSLIQEGDDKKVALSLLDLEKDKTWLLK